ncbi:MAG: translocation/assembly module TamB domain-containing protein, partial [Alcanivorax sp.]|nr:translocation/assembly module TamB domain-containing protein [Alcanivorax sp.]
WGSNHIHVDGQIGAALDLHGTLAMSQLALLTPQSGGRLNGTLQLTGTPTEPQLSGTLNGHHLRWLQWQLGHLKASFSQLGPGPQAMSVSLQGDSLKQQDALRVQRFSLEGKGKRQQHHLTLSLQQQGVNLQSQFQGGLDPHWQWQGQLQDTRLSQPSLGQWRQRQHAALTLGAHRQQLSRLCLDNGNSNLCLQGQHDQHDRIESQITITALPLALADSLLPPTAGLQGKLDARLALNGTLKAPRGQLSMAAQQAQLLINDPDHPQRLPIRTLSLHSQLNQGRADNRLSLESPLGEIHAQVESGLSLTDPMTGTVDLSAQSLAPLALFTADLRDIDGQVQGHLKLAGSPQQPVLNGQLQLQQGHFQVPRLGIAVEQIHVRVQGSPLGRLDLQGQATLGGQPLIMAGEIDPTRQPFILNLRAHGKNLLIANRPDARLHVTPDLTLSHEQGTLALRGELLIPDAEIRPLQLPPDAITVSDDQVLVHQNIAANTPLPLDTRLTLKLGDQVHFNGFGLDAMLGGSLQVQQAPRSPMQLNGELLIREGRYKAYGQNLGITDGRLLFQGPPDNPGLDIRAIRKIPSENIIAGVQLSGTLKQPSASVFSDPPMGESQAMAYLLTGHSLERGSSSDSAHVAQALALYGLEKGSGVTDKIGNKLGLDQVTLGSDWETSDAALMLGKQLSERLYLSYSVGLFDALSTVMLRYTLSRQIHLEARSNSKANSLDLIWEKELE